MVGVTVVVTVVVVVTAATTIEPPGLSIDDASAVRDGESAAFVVRLSATSDKLVTVAYETVDGNGRGGG